MSTFLTLLVVKILLICGTRSQSHIETCRRRPFLYPEIYLDYHTCSTVFDWSRAITDSCRDDFMSYEVELIKDCNTKPVTTINKQNVFRDYVPGECLADDDCYMRVRARLTDDSFSSNGTWTGLSNKYRIFQACVVKGGDICLPIQMCRRGNNTPILPSFIINQELYIPIIGDQRFNATIVNSSKICFEHVTDHVHYIELCHESLVNPTCNQYNNEIIKLLKTGLIQVTSDNCGTCYDTCGLTATSQMAQKNHCVEIDWEMISDSSANTLRNVCISIESSRNITKSLLYSLQLIDLPAIQPSCQEYSDAITQNKQYQFSLEDRQERGIMLCTAHTDKPLDTLTNISRGSITQCRNNFRSFNNTIVSTVLFTIISLTVV